VNSVIEVEDLQVRKDDSTICHVPELKVEPAERVVIVGDNGTGKTTLLRVLAGLEKEFSGRCAVNVSTRERVFVHQSPLLFRGNVLFNASYGLAAQGIPKSAREATAREWLARLGIDHLADRRAGKLSGGEQRRVALARALALQPVVVLLDEPFAELDEAGIDIVGRAIASLRESTVLISSPVPLPGELSGREVRVGG